MQKKEISFRLAVFDNRAELNEADQQLLQRATEAIQHAYAPYSKFFVGAAILLENGVTVAAANQENAAYPMCVCAEVVALSSATSQHPGVAPVKMAIYISSSNQTSSQPAAPCGQCRQTIFEYENRFGKKIGILMAAKEGPVYQVDSISDLLPLHFSAGDL
ncbi:MAG: cytidine deaminase [Chitinophagales bacterium]